MYNPEVDTQYNIVPGLMGVILTMTMIMITGLAITRERERGTMENLLSMPTRPSEVLIGKIVPYILVGYIQVTVILVAARISLFHVPMHGSIPLLLVVALIFIAANLAMGITFSTIAKNQLQAMQMTFFVDFLPVHPPVGLHVPLPPGMPVWAQTIGEKSSRSLISFASSAASCSKATAFRTCRANSGPSPSSPSIMLAIRREALPPNAGLTSRMKAEV